jgi:biotin carboxyl carrier protein
MSEEKKNAAKTVASDMQPLNINGDIYYTRYTRKYTQRQAWTKPDEREVQSFIPGTVREVFVKDGETVHHGQKLMILEAMKMMNTIYAQADGTIASVLVAKGDRIPKGTVMIRFA